MSFSMSWNTRLHKIISRLFGILCTRWAKNKLLWISNFKYPISGCHDFMHRASNDANLEKVGKMIARSFRGHKNHSKWSLGRQSTKNTKLVPQNWKIWAKTKLFFGYFVRAHGGYEHKAGDTQMMQNQNGWKDSCDSFRWM